MFRAADQIFMRGLCALCELNHKNILLYKIFFYTDSIFGDSIADKFGTIPSLKGKYIMKKALIASVMAFSCAVAGAAGMDGWTLVSQEGDNAKFQHENGVAVDMTLLGKVDTEAEAGQAVLKIIGESGLKCGEPYEVNDQIVAVDCDVASFFFRYAESDKEFVMGYTQCKEDACAPVVDLLNEATKQ